MFLILANPDDRLACRAHDLLRERHGAGRVRHLTGEDLALGTRWALRQDGPSVCTRMRLADGTELSSADLTAVFNRLRFVRLPHFGAASASDQDYALMEIHAFLLSWLSSLECVVINRASPRGLAGDCRGTAEWLRLAGRAGLPARAMSFASSARRFTKTGYDAYVPLAGAGLAADAALRPSARAILGRSPAHFLETLGDESRQLLVVGATTHRGDDLPAPLAEGCLRLARAAGCDLIGFEFAQTKAGAPGGWRFCGADPFPQDLRGAEVEALVGLLESGAVRPGGAAE